MGSFGINSRYVIVETTKVERIQSKKNSGYIQNLGNINISGGGHRKSPYKKARTVRRLQAAPWNCRFIEPKGVEYL